MATPNYSYEKRQRELAKKQKKLDKERAKAERKSSDEGGLAPGAGQADAAASAGEAGERART
ncbi:hypothetical protein [Comamonas composti]|uniref:hypothetical protein n=1 Tax=Comamonas composti TaxID=408558 RepID=UPI00040184BE|nr:hypothetical protein [Comamonas composti]